MPKGSAWMTVQVLRLHWQMHKPRTLPTITTGTRYGFQLPTRVICALSSISFIVFIFLFFFFLQQYGGWGQNTWGQYAQYNQYNQYYPPPPTWWRKMSRWRLRGKHLFLSDTEQDFTAGCHGDFSPTTDPNLFLLIFSVTSVKFGSNSLK